MGKKGSNKKGAESASKTSKCSCDDPYRCICGNRPERPSKGHKWDPIAQQWGGKGHKQKGASGQTSTVGVAAKTTAVGKTSIAEWQKLPHQLLDSFCRKEKRPNPKYKSLEGCKPNNFKYRVIIQDAKVTKRGGEHDMIFIPAAEVPNEEQAREEAALLALLHLTPTLPHERILPEPYKTTWISSLANMKEKNKPSQKLKSSESSRTIKNENKHETHNRLDNYDRNQTAQASSSLTQANNYTSLAEKRQQIDAKRKERNVKIRKHEAIRMANKNAQVFMSAQIRKQIESFLRGDIDEELLEALASGEEMSEDEYEDDDDNIVKRYVIERLSHEGFSKSQATTSYKSVMQSPSPLLLSSESNEDRFMDKTYEECLQWLCVHLNEEQLPEGFDPRGRTLDVVMPSKSGKKEKKSSDCDVTIIPDEEIELTEKYGCSMMEATLILKSATRQNMSIVDVLNRALIKANGESILNKSVSSESIERNKVISSDEIEVLQSMFTIGEDLHIKSEGGKIEFFINMNDADNNKKILHISYNEGLYPSTYPNVFVEGGWKEGYGSMFHINLVNFVRSLSTEEPMIFEIFGYVQGTLTDCNNISSTEMSLVAFLDDSMEASSSCIVSKSKQIAPTKPLKTTLVANKPKLRSREKSFFWNKSPSQTPHATSFPEISDDMRTARQRLPAAKARDEFLSVMKLADSQNRVVLVTGETGCGKTTQIPQFILEEAPKSAKIVVAQPRRLAATGVADRVAKERGEEKAGLGSVGYVVRGDVAMCSSTRLMFCTTGVLLRQLQSEGALDCISHIVIDEVHERHLDTDVLLGILKISRPSHLRVILMSATMDADRFAAYWGNDTPRMHIPGFTHPVKDFTLEDVISLTGYFPKIKGEKKSFSRDPNQIQNISNFETSDHPDQDNVYTGDQSSNSLALPVEELVLRIGDDVDYNLIAILIRHLVDTKNTADDGSILVFLSGAPEINKAQDAISRITNGKELIILPLHGSLQPKDQQRVFQKAARGITKVILSTNVAETSITIPDCTMVIDTCKEKQSSYDPSNRMPLLVETFCSRDSLKQRRGRAGRVRPGSCYKLISRNKLETLSQHGEPEIKRCALDQTLLSLLFLGIEQGSGEFLSTLLDPPLRKSIDAAIYSLQKLGAITIHSRENTLSLTPLGNHIAGIPAPPCVGKILVMGSMLGCRAAALAIAAGMSIGKNPFIRIDTFERNRNNNFSEKDEKQEWKNQQILQERKKMFESVGNSDLALLAAAYMKWDGIKGGSGDKKRFCEQLGLSIHSVRDMKQMVNQLGSSLSAVGFVNTDSSDENTNSWRIIRSCIVSSLAPAQIVRVQRAAIKYTETVEGAVKKDGVAKELKFYTRSNVDSDLVDTTKLCTAYHNIPEERVFIHPSSANFSVGEYSCPWIVYQTLVRTTKPFLRDANECNIYDLLLFGGKLEVSSSDGIIIIDDYVRLSANARIGALIGGLRRKVDDILSKKITDPKIDVAKSVEMKLIVKLLRTDGLGR